MGRKNRNGRALQSSRQDAQREIRRSKRIEVPKAFGIRRPLEPQLGQAIVVKMAELQQDGDIPGTVKLRYSLHASLLPQRVFGKQLLKGLATGYHLGRMSSRLEECGEGSCESPVRAEVRGVRVYKGKVIYVSLESAAMEAERQEIAQIMGSFGLKGLEKLQKENLLHMTIGESRKGLSVTEQRHVGHVIHEELDRLQTAKQVEALPFEPWHVYPNLEFWQQ